MAESVQDPHKKISNNLTTIDEPVNNTKIKQDNYGESPLKKAMKNMEDFLKLEDKISERQKEEREMELNELKKNRPTSNFNYKYIPVFGGVCALIAIILRQYIKKTDDESSNLISQGQEKVEDEEACLNTSSVQ